MFSFIHRHVSFRERWAKSAHHWNKHHQLAHALMIVIGVVFVWRGIWNLADFYLVPLNPIIGDFTSVIFGVFILMLDDFGLKELE